MIDSSYSIAHYTLALVKDVKSFMALAPERIVSKFFYRINKMTNSVKVYSVVLQLVAVYCVWA
jgi:hypothetical protein